MSSTRIDSLWLLRADAVSDPARLTVDEMKSAIPLSPSLAAVTAPTGFVEWMTSAPSGGVFRSEILCATTARRNARPLPDDLTMPPLPKPQVAKMLAEVGHCGQALGAVLWHADGRWELWQLYRSSEHIPKGSTRVEMSKVFAGFGMRSKGRARFEPTASHETAEPFRLFCQDHAATIDRAVWDRGLAEARKSPGGLMLYDLGGADGRLDPQTP